MKVPSLLPLASPMMVATNSVAAGDGIDFNAPPAIAGWQYFLRSNRNHYCIDAMQTAGAGN